MVACRTSRDCPLKERCRCSQAIHGYGVSSILLITSSPSYYPFWYAVVRSRIYCSVSSSGYLIISSNIVCFWGKSLGPCDIKHRFPISTIKSVKPIHLTFSRPNGLVLEIKTGFSLKLVFFAQENRDEAITRISDLMNASHAPTSLSRTVTPSSSSLPESPTKSLKTSATGLFAPLSRSLAAAVAVGLPTAAQIRMPKAINLPQHALLAIPPMHFVCLTIGSRGDVQPYIALGLGLQKEGHRVTIVTHEEYKGWIEGFEIGHRTAGGDPGALMKLSVENKVCNSDLPPPIYCLTRFSRCFLLTFSKSLLQK